MLIKIKRGWELPEAAATPESTYYNRRQILKAAAAGPILAGRIFDLTGSYDPAFTTLAVMATIGLALASRLPAPQRG